MLGAEKLQTVPLKRYAKKIDTSLSTMFVVTRKRQAELAHR